MPMIQADSWAALLTLEKIGGKRTHRVCMKDGCSNPATRGVVWADGRGTAISCVDHVNHFKRTLSDVCEVKRYDPDAPKGKKYTPLIMNAKGKREIEQRDLRLKLKRLPKYPRGGGRQVNVEERNRIYNRLTRLAKTAELAPGIPSKRVRRIPVVRSRAPNEEWDMSMSLHPAKRRGDHIDLRLVDPDGHAHSWALPAEMPKPGKAVYAVQQPTHTGEYALQKKPFELPPGYGETRQGEKVTPITVAKTEIVEAGQNKVRFLEHLGKKTREFVLRRLDAPTPDGKRMWVLNNATKTVGTLEGKRLPLYKPKYKATEPEKIDFDDDDKVLSAKIDGAHTVMALHGKDKPVRVYSYRQPRAEESGLIEHTHKFPEHHLRRSSNELKGTIIRTELWGSRDGKAIHATDVGGLLNSGTLKSRRKQEATGTKLRLTAIDVDRYKGRKFEDKPFADKLRVLREVVGKVRDADGEPVLELPPMAFTAEEKRRLHDLIKGKKLPETEEGLVQWDLAEPRPMKAVFRPDHDVYVRGVFKKPRGEARGHAGGFEYSWTPDGPVVGRVGTGFTHAMRRDMLQNPEDYVGRVAKVKSMDAKQNKTDPSQLGALRAAGFKGWHLDKNTPEMMKEAGAERPFRLSDEARLGQVASTVNRLNAAAMSLDPSKMVGATARSLPTILPMMRRGRGILAAAERLQEAGYQLPKVGSVKSVGVPIAAGLAATGIGASVALSHRRMKKDRRRRELKRQQTASYQTASRISGAVGEAIRRHEASGKKGPMRMQVVIPGMPSMRITGTKKTAAKKDYGPGGKWIHDRAHGMMESMKEQYGDKKGQAVAYATATQQAHAVKKSPKKFKTPEGVRVAKAKYQHPKEMRKTAWAPTLTTDQAIMLKQAMS